MVEVICKYFNKGKKKEDEFIYTDVLVKGHASNIDYSTNNKVCAGISACCFGIKNIIDVTQYHLSIGEGYFHCQRTTNALTRDKQSIYALNTLVCQLYEIYRNYPNSFKCFELVDVKENKNGWKQNNKKWMGIYPC